MVKSVPLSPYLSKFLNGFQCVDPFSTLNLNLDTIGYTTGDLCTPIILILIVINFILFFSQEIKAIGVKFTRLRCKSISGGITCYVFML